MSRRFDYVKYDEKATALQEEFKQHFVELEELAEKSLPASRERSLFLTVLEEAYMWTGKAIRDDQISRGVQPDHVPERG